MIIPNKKYGHLTPLKQTVSGKHSKWLCVCDCGTEKEIRTDQKEPKVNNNAYTWLYCVYIIHRFV